MFVPFKLKNLNKVTFVFEQMPAIGSCHVSCPVKFVIYFSFIFILRFSPIMSPSWNNASIAQILRYFLSCSVSIYTIIAMI